MVVTKTHRTVATLFLGLACLAVPRPSYAVTAPPLAGSLVGVVSDSGGVPQMGAAVFLFTRSEKLAQRLTTDQNGEFRFLGLLPDNYSIKVMLAPFVPAYRRDIRVQSGFRSVLNINMSALFSNIQLSYPRLDNGTLMTDDWKWILRSAPATRPVTRFNAGLPPRVSSQRSAAFRETRGVLKVSAGEGPLASSIGNQADMGTAFALATSLYGNSLQVSGNVGYGSQTGVPTAAFRTSYKREGAPEVSLTMRQLFLPARMGYAFSGNDTALPMLRSMAASFDDRTQLDDHVYLQYGFTLESVSFLDHLNNFSPYARLSYDMDDWGTIEWAYTSGNARPDLAASLSPDADLQRGLNALGMFPRISLRGARARIQRGQEYEMAYSRKVGSRTFGVSMHHEKVSNAALNVVAPAGLYTQGDILPDLFSGNSVFNSGDYQSNGITVSASQQIGENITATVIYGSLGALSVEDRELVTSSPDELRAMIRAGRKQSATVRVTATNPGTGTHMIASYQVRGDHRWAMPGNIYSTLPQRPTPGLNIYLRQPLPRIGLMPWRMELNADLRNLLAEGYLPIQMSNGQQLLLVETPRSVSGGFSFIF